MRVSGEWWRPKGIVEHLLNEAGVYVDRIDRNKHKHQGQLLLHLVGNGLPDECLGHLRREVSVTFCQVDRVEGDMNNDPAFEICKWFIHED